MSAADSKIVFEQTLVVGPFQCNCRIVACQRTGEAILVDPGDEPAKILNALKEAKTPSGAPIQVKYLFHTHGHLDHIGATRQVREVLVHFAPGIPQIAIHKDDESLYLQLQMQGRIFGVQYKEPLPVDHYLEDEEEFKIGDLKFSIIHTPGHSPGSVCFRLHSSEESEVLYSGDTLFQGSVGRTDLWGGDQDQLFRNIRQRLFTLDGETRVCPGHGADTTIEKEKRENPFFK